MDKDIVKDAVEGFNDAESHWSEQRACALEDLKFTRLGEQWEESAKNDRDREGRPCLTVNNCPRFARQVVNNARQNKPRIKVHPVDDQADVETAEIMNGLIRNIEYTSNAEVAYDTGLECAVYSGLGYFRIGMDYASYDQFDMDILIERIANPLSVYPDINTTACDASDWMRGWIMDELDRDTFKEKYPDADPIEWNAKDIDSNWTQKDAVKTAEYWKREEEDSKLVQLNDGTVMLEDKFLEYQDFFFTNGLTVVRERPTKIYNVTQYILTAREILEEVEWPGRYIPIIPVYGEEFEVDGKRYFKSMFRDAKDAQRMINYWRTASTELVALAPKAPFVGAKGQFKSDGKRWATANTDSHPYLEYDMVTGKDGATAPPPQRQPFAGVPAGAIQEAISAAEDMKGIIGMHDPSLGINEQEMSGIAINREQQIGDISNFHFVDNLSRGMRYAGRVLLDLIPQVYSNERVIRVLGYDGTVDSVPINQEYEKGGTVKIHDFSKGKYDMTVEVGPGYNTKRQEAVRTMTDIVKAAPELMHVAGDLIATNMDWEGADDLARRLKAMLPPQILAMEKLEGLPEEAQPIVSHLQNQVKQLQQTIEQGKGLIMERDRFIQEQNAKLEDKSEGHQIDREKIEAGKWETLVKEQGDMQLEVMKKQLEQTGKEQLAYIQAELDAMKEIFTQQGSMQ